MEKLQPIIFFVDNNTEEIMSLWENCHLSKNHLMISFTPFKSLEETIYLITSSKANVIILGHYLDGKITGVDVMDALKKEEYSCIYISNTGGDANKLFPKIYNHANRDPWHLWNAVTSEKGEGGRLKYLSYDANLKNFCDSINKKNYKEGLSLMKRIKHYHHLEGYVHAILKGDYCKDSFETVESVLEYFIEQREDICPEHGFWVHSVSHFDNKLWELGLKKQLQVLLKIAITGANELNDENCSDRLIGGFFRFSEYTDNPLDYGITEKNIKFSGYLNEYGKHRIQTGVYETKEAHVLSKLQFADTPMLISWSNDYQLILLEEENIENVIQELRNIRPVDVLEVNDIKQNLYQKQLHNLESSLILENSEKQIGILRNAIEMTKTLLKK